jgi:molybdopterin synthase sulfur carrier subunit
MALIRLRNPLKQYAGGVAEHEAAAGTVLDALRELEQAQPGVRGWILDERGQLRRHINVFLNGEPASGDTAVGAKDRIDVLPAISGGS